MKHNHVCTGCSEPGGKSIQPVQRMVRDAGFSARGIRRYTLGATPGIQLITGENHVVGLDIVLGTGVTTSTSGGGAR